MNGKSLKTKPSFYIRLSLVVTAISIASLLIIGFPLYFLTQGATSFGAFASLVDNFLGLWIYLRIPVISFLVVYFYKKPIESKQTYLYDVAIVMLLAYTIQKGISFILF